MQEKAFKDILQKHAGQFSLEPSSDRFSAMMEKREKAKKGRKRRLGMFMLVAAVIVAVSLTIVFIQGKHNEPLLAGKAKEITLPAEKDGGSAEKPHIVSSAKSRLNENAGEKDKEKSVVTSEYPDKTKPATLTITHKDPAGKALVPIQKVSKAKKSGQTNRSNTIAGNVSAAVSVTNQTGNKGGIDPNPTTVNIKEGDKTPAHTKVYAGGLTSDSVVAVAQAKEEVIQQKDTLIKNTTDTTLVAQAPVPPIPVSKSTGKQKWIASLAFTPQLVNSVYSANSDADLSWLNNYLDNKRENDHARFCYNAGVRIERMLGERFSVGTGVFLSVIKFEELKVIHELPATPSDTANPGVQLAFEEGKIREVDRNRYDISFTSLEIPLMVNYAIPMKRFHIQLSSGIAYSYLLTTRSLVFDKTDSLNVRETNDAKNDRLQHHNIILIAGANVRYDIGSSWSIYTGPVYRFALQSLYSKDYVIKQRPYFIGLETGIQFHF